MNGKQKLFWFLFLPLLMFLFANTTNIRTGVCGSSPCSTINESYVLGDVYEDTFIESYTNVLLAPTAFLLTPILDSQNLYVFQWKDNPAVLRFDHKEETIPKPPDGSTSRMTYHDPKSFTGIFLFIKFIIFLSFPFWILVSYGFYKLFLGKKKLAVTLMIVFFMLAGLWKFGNHLLNYLGLDFSGKDGKNSTFEHIISHPYL